MKNAGLEEAHETGLQDVQSTIDEAPGRFLPNDRPAEAVHLPPVSIRKSQVREAERHCSQLDQPLEGALVLQEGFRDLPPGPFEPRQQSTDAISGSRTHSTSFQLTQPASAASLKPENVLQISRIVDQKEPMLLFVPIAWESPNVELVGTQGAYAKRRTRHLGETEPRLHRHPTFGAQPFVRGVAVCLP
jgi:hypothetical protein